MDTRTFHSWQDATLPLNQCPLRNGRRTMRSTSVQMKAKVALQALILHQEVLAELRARFKQVKRK